MLGGWMPLNTAEEREHNNETAFLRSLWCLALTKRGQYGGGVVLPPPSLSQCCPDLHDVPSRPGLGRLAGCSYGRRLLLEDRLAIEVCAVNNKQHIMSHNVIFSTVEDHGQKQIEPYFLLKNVNPNCKLSRMTVFWFSVSAPKVLKTI